ncbi:MAG: hypothetical protein ACR2RF_17000 [Geminicoccaceae bacterium]
MQIVKRALFFVGGLVAALVTFLVVDVSSQNGKAAMAETSKLIAYQVVDRRESGPTKLSLTVEVPLVDGRIPFERELRALSDYLFSLEKPYDRKFVTYYLPGMKHSEGAFATGQSYRDQANGQEQPKLDVFLRPYMLSKYPEYAKFAQ